ncbi:MAG: hypothetical protein PW792_00895 [Acidobacteriaceae bacterium]|nr:hypothetical protein [Acidobacteriaceae bacterium]
MRPLGPIEAISPAIARTRLVLFTPFRFGGTWKISISAYLGVLGTVFMPWPMMYLAFFFKMVPAQARGAFPTSILMVMSLVFFAVYVALFYLCSRLQFSVFGLVLHRESRVASAWRTFGDAALPWTLFKMVTGCVVLGLLAVPLVRMVSAFVPLLDQLQAKPGQPMDPQAFHALLAFYGAFFGLYLIFGLYMWVNSLLADFIVPSLALERVSLREAFRRLFVLVRQEPLQVLGYALMKPLLAIAGFLVALILFEIAIVIVVLVLVLVALLIGVVLHLLHVPTAVLSVLAVCVGLVMYVFLIVYGCGVSLGPVMVFLEAYLQCFLGGRYPLLGDALDATTPPPPAVYYPPVMVAPPPAMEG